MRRLGFDLILLGAPAAGKDTQADILIKKYKNLKPVRSGTYWRQLAKKNNDTGEVLRRTVNRGFAAPVALMREFIFKNINSVRKNQDLIFIGNPRLVPEAKLLNKLLVQKNRDYIVISLVLPVLEVKKRAAKRNRDEQDVAFVSNRIKMYKTQVTKTLDYFRDLKKLKVIKGNQTIKQVNREIVSIINDYQRSKANSIT